MVTLQSVHFLLESSYIHAHIHTYTHTPSHTPTHTHTYRISFSSALIISLGTGITPPGNTPTDPAPDLQAGTNLAEITTKITGTGNETEAGLVGVGMGVVIERSVATPRGARVIVGGLVPIPETAGIDSGPPEKNPTLEIGIDLLLPPPKEEESHAPILEVAGIDTILETGLIPIPGAGVVVCRVRVVAIARRLLPEGRNLIPLPLPGV